MFFPKKIERILNTWFGCGLSPIAPGTMGSIGALPLCWVLVEYTDLYFRIAFAVGFTMIAILAAAQDQASGGERDAQYIVIDEVAGMLISTILIPSGNLKLFILPFIIFRILDITKPFPANWFDKRSKTSENTFHRGAHIVLDDVVSGIYTCIIVAILHKTLSSL